MTDTRDRGTTGVAPIRVWCGGEGITALFDPSDFLDCKTEGEVSARVYRVVEWACRVVEWAAKVAFAYPEADHVAKLWAAVQALRERGE